MIEATFYTNEQDRIWSFEIHGHAGFAQNGDPDIVCAAVSALSLNTVNGLERFSQDPFQYEMDEDGFLSARVPRGGRTAFCTGRGTFTPGCVGKPTRH